MKGKSEGILAQIWTIFKAIVAYGHLKNSGVSNGNKTHDLCDTGALLYQLIYEAHSWWQVNLLGSCAPVKDTVNEINV